MIAPYDIIDVEFDRPIETLYPGWDVWSCTVTLSDGSTIEGTIQGDGLTSWDIESFEEDEGDV